MAEINKIKSFKTFSEVMAQEAAVKEAEANAAKRSELSAKISALLDEMNITSFEDLDEEVKREFITKAFGQISEEEAGLPAEELEDETKDVTEPTVDADGSEVESEVEDVEKDLELEGEGDAEGEEIAEGNAFIFAAAKAKADGQKEFEFNGKKYKVTLKKDTGLKESVMIITEGTRGQFGKIYKNGEIASVYTHYDSYPENMLPTIERGYKKGANVDTVISQGSNSGLEVSPDKMNFYGGPNDLKPLKGSVKNVKKYINMANDNGAEFIYLFDERDQKWYMVDVYGGGRLVPAFESFQVNEAEVTSDDEFKEYAFAVLQKAFGEEFDEAKAQEIVDGILGKVDGDYGAAVGMLTSSLGESVEVNESCGECGQNPCECDSVEEKKADGTISDDEDERREDLMSKVEVSIDDLLAMIKKEAFDIGGNFRSPGIMYDAKKIIEDKLKKFK